MKSTRCPTEDLVIYLRVPVAEAHRLVGEKGARDYTKLRRDLQESDSRTSQAASRVYDELAPQPNWVQDRMLRCAGPARCALQRQFTTKYLGRDRSARSRRAATPMRTLESPMGFNEFLGNERIVSALRGMLRRERVPERAALHRAARHRQIHAGAHVRAGRELRAPEGRLLRRMRLLPAAWRRSPIPRR